MKVREYDILSRAVEEGISLGISRADKYEIEDPEHLEQCIYNAVMIAICEVFEFEEPKSEES